MQYKLQRSNRLSLLIIIVTILALFVCGISTTSVFNQQAESHISSKGNLLMQTILSVRNYTSQQVNPVLASRLETEPQFLPQTVPGYSAREVFENLREKTGYANYFYKEATLNPTNLRDKADAFETGLVETFRRNPNLQDQTGYRTTVNGRIFYTSRPLKVDKASCLRCHSTPAAAPKSQIATYGDSNGFGWKLNEIIGAQVLSVPASEVLESAQRSFVSVIGVVSITFLCSIFLILKFKV
jgi:hypothetical protein